LYVYGTGEQTRCFTYVEDTVEGTYRALSPVANGQVFNIGSDRPVTIMETARQVVRLTSSSSLIRTCSYEEAYGLGYEDMMKRGATCPCCLSRSGPVTSDTVVWATREREYVWDGNPTTGCKRPGGDGCQFSPGGGQRVEPAALCVDKLCYSVRL
jgi:NAD dependent epimerase/dehydratase family